MSGAEEAATPHKHDKQIDPHHLRAASVGSGRPFGCSAGPLVGWSAGRLVGSGGGFVQANNKNNNNANVTEWGAELLSSERRPNKRPSSTRRPLAARNRPADADQPIGGRTLQVASCKLRAASCELRAASNSRAGRCEPPIGQVHLSITSRRGAAATRATLWATSARLDAPRAQSADHSQQDGAHLSAGRTLGDASSSAPAHLVGRLAGVAQRRGARAPLHSLISGWLADWQAGRPADWLAASPTGLSGADVVASEQQSGPAGRTYRAPTADHLNSLRPPRQRPTFGLASARALLAAKLRPAPKLTPGRRAGNGPTLDGRPKSDARLMATRAARVRLQWGVRACGLHSAVGHLVCRPRCRAQCMFCLYNRPVCRPETAPAKLAPHRRRPKQLRLSALSEAPLAL